MPSVFIEFPLKDKITSVGIVPDPKITVNVLTKFGYEPFSFLLDTGADCTIVPLSLAEDIGIDLRQSTKARTYGIEGNGIVGRVGKIQIMIGDKQLQITCMFAERETMPYILGRMDIFSNFNISFDNVNKKIILFPI